jgi:hypothetical protein
MTKDMRIKAEIFIKVKILFVAFKIKRIEVRNIN